MPKSDNRNKVRSKDWMEWTSGWQYKTEDPKNRQWNKDRKELFRKNGNGWWWFQKSEGDMPNQRAKTRKRNRIKLNERHKREGRTANQIKKRREKDKRNDLNRN